MLVWYQLQEKQLRVNMGISKLRQKVKEQQDRVGRKVLCVDNWLKSFTYRIITSFTMGYLFLCQLKVLWATLLVTAGYCSKKSGSSPG